MRSESFQQCANHATENDKVAVENFYKSHHRARDIIKAPDGYHYIVVKNYITQNSEGKPATTSSIVAQQLQNANDMYKNSPYQFVMDTTEIIVSDVYYNYPLFQKESEITATYNKWDKINVYWSNSLCTSGNECYCGYAYYPWSSIK